MKPHLQTTIWTLLKAKASQREIERVTGISRHTIRSYQQRFAGEQANCPGVATSQCEPWREFIEEQLRLKRNATAIYQDLVDQHGFGGKYNSVKRFVAKLRHKEPEQFDRLSFLPGEEMQVDYGEGAPTRVAGSERYKKPQPETKAAIWAALLTGARRGELFKIKAEHIGADSIMIPASHTKTNTARVVPIIPALRPWLEFFPLTLTVEGLKSNWQRARVRAGMEHVNFHDLRHSCASIMLSLGVDLYTISKILGHSTIQTTQRYSHLQVDAQRAALEKLGDLVMRPAKKATRLSSP